MYFVRDSTNSSGYRARISVKTLTEKERKKFPQVDSRAKRIGGGRRAGRADMQRAREHAESGLRRWIFNDDLPEIHAPGLRPECQGPSALGGKFDDVRRQTRKCVLVR